jgi:hypothetical protein
MTEEKFEELQVKELGDRIGYGRIMHLCEKLWRRSLIAQGYPAGGEFAYGPCVAFMVPCPHLEKDKGGHCLWCCGAGRVTKHVLAVQIERNGGGT